jgi:hypothetical protein
MASTKVREIEIDEVLPKGARTSAKDDPFIAFVARLMDNQFVVPGTNLRFGLDPLLGLLPGWGDSASALVSALLILKSARAGVPKVILSRMVLNILINAAVGAVPGVGDAFSFWFKSNAKNLALHQKHAGTARRISTRDWLFVGALLGGMLALIALFFLATFGLALQAFHWILGAQ